jgi:hypothetical protein
MPFAGLVPCMLREIALRSRFNTREVQVPDDLMGGGWEPADVTGIVANPFYAIQLDPGLGLPHDTLITEEQWVQANVRLIEELGAVAYLRNLLQILKKPIAAEEDEDPLVEEALDISETEPGHASIRVDELDGYVMDQLFRRLEREPQFLARSAAVLHETLRYSGDDPEELAEEVYDLEEDPGLLAEVLRATRNTRPTTRPEAERLLVLYTIDRVIVGSPSQPLADRIQIRWRIPEAAAKSRVARAKNIARNDSCPCGSGRKYKRCCGSPGPSVP